MVKKNKVTDEERDRIAVLHARGIGIREIARLLDRNHAYTCPHKLDHYVR